MPHLQHSLDSLVVIDLHQNDLHARESRWPKHGLADERPLSRPTEDRPLRLAAYFLGFSFNVCSLSKRASLNRDVVKTRVFSIGDRTFRRFRPLARELRSMARD